MGLAFCQRDELVRCVPKSCQHVARAAAAQGPFTLRPSDPHAPSPPRNAFGYARTTIRGGRRAQGQSATAILRDTVPGAHACDSASSTLQSRARRRPWQRSPHTRTHHARAAAGLSRPRQRSPTGCASTAEARSTCSSPHRTGSSSSWVWGSSWIGVKTPQSMEGGCYRPAHTRAGSNTGTCSTLATGIKCSHHSCVQQLSQGACEYCCADRHPAAGHLPRIESDRKLVFTSSYSLQFDLRA